MSTLSPYILRLARLARLPAPIPACFAHAWLACPFPSPRASRTLGSPRRSHPRVLRARLARLPAPIPACIAHASLAVFFRVH